MTRSQLVFGILFITLGVLLFADRAGQLAVWAVVALWWPAVIVLAGVAQLATRPRNVLGGLLLAAIGGVLLLWTHRIVDTVAYVWPVLLIGLGLWLLSGRATRVPHEIHGGSEHTAVFDDRDIALEPGPFTGGSATAVFGDLDLDLRHTTLGPDGATLAVTTVFGDVEVEVPHGWRIQASGPELLGDLTVRYADEPPANAPVLRLRVTIVVGDVTVRGAPAEASTAAQEANRVRH